MPSDNIALHSKTSEPNTVDIPPKVDDFKEDPNHQKFEMDAGYKTDSGGIEGSVEPENLHIKESEETDIVYYLLSWENIHGTDSKESETIPASPLNTGNAEGDTHTNENVNDTVKFTDFNTLLRYDNNSDNHLQLDEFTNIMRGISGKLESEEIESIFNTLDYNGSGRVGSDEYTFDTGKYTFNGANIIYSALLPNSSKVDGFHQYDMHLDIAEFNYLLNSEQISLSQEEITDLFNFIDQDGSSRIGIEEYQQFTHEYVWASHQGDGSVPPTEYMNLKRVGGSYTADEDCYVLLINSHGTDNTRDPQLKCEDHLVDWSGTMDKYGSLHKLEAGDTMNIKAGGSTQLVIMYPERDIEIVNPGKEGNRNPGASGVTQNIEGGSGIDFFAYLDDEGGPNKPHRDKANEAIYSLNTVQYAKGRDDNVSFFKGDVGHVMGRGNGAQVSFRYV